MIIQFILLTILFSYSTCLIAVMLCCVGIVSTIAGNGTRGYHDGPAETAQFNNPCYLAMVMDDHTGAATTLYITEDDSSCIRKLDLLTGLYVYACLFTFI